MIDPIDPLLLSQVEAPREAAPVPTGSTGSVFDDILGKAIETLNDVSKTEFTANNLIDEYTVGKAELSDVMIATAKMSIAVQLAVTAITSAVNTFKEITQMAI